MAYMLSSENVMRNHRRFSKPAGFTLVELLIVIAIIAILVSIALPQFMKYKQTAANAALLSDANNTFIAATAFLNDPQNIVVDSEQDIIDGGFVSSQVTNFISANMSPTIGEIILISDTAESTLNKAVIKYTGEITLGPAIP